VNRRAVVVCVVALATAAVPALGSSRAGRAAAVPQSGTVYIESNSKAPGSNEILAFSYKNGMLSGRHIRRYPTGGSG